jgi:hypothetical protein
MREGRRILGDYILTENDILENRRFADGVAYGGWAMDVHTAHGLYDFDKNPSFIRCFDGAYEIPYRCYYSRNVDNLMMAGKIISATKMGISSARVIGTCAIGGQAVGTAAAMCIHKGTSPRGLLPYMAELRRDLVRDDCYLPGFSERDSLLSDAAVTASSAKDSSTAEAVIRGESRAIGNEENCWVSDGIAEGGEWLMLTLPEARTLQQIRLTFDSNFNYPIKITLSNKRRAQQRIGVPPELVRDYRVRLWRDGNVVAERAVTDNNQRLNVLDFGGIAADAVECIFEKANGCEDVRVFAVDGY